MRKGIFLQEHIKIAVDHISIDSNSQRNHCNFYRSPRDKENIFVLLSGKVLDYDNS